MFHAVTWVFWMVAKVLIGSAWLQGCYYVVCCYGFSISGMVSLHHTNAVNHCGRAIFTHFIQENRTKRTAHIRWSVCVIGVRSEPFPPAKPACEIIPFPTAWPGAREKPDLIVLPHLNVPLRNTLHIQRAFSVRFPLMSGVSPRVPVRLKFCYFARCNNTGRANINRISIIAGVCEN